MNNNIIHTARRWFQSCIELGEVYAYLGQFIVSDALGYPTSRIVAVRAFSTRSLIFFGHSCSGKVSLIRQAEGRSTMVFYSMKARKQMVLRGETHVESQSSLREQHWLSHPLAYRQAHLDEDFRLLGAYKGTLNSMPDTYAAFHFLPLKADFLEFSNDYHHQLIHLTAKQ